MKITSVNKLKVATYAIVKHWQGYRLLKNTQGTSPDYVRMIRYGEGIDPRTTDIFQTYERITKDFSKKNDSIQQEILNIDNYKKYNIKNEVTETKKNKYYECNTPTEREISKVSILQDEIETRDLTELHKPQYDSIELVNNEISLDSFKPRTLFPVAIKKSFAELTVEQFLKKNQNQNTLTFATNLFHNLFG